MDARLRDLRYLLRLRRASLGFSAVVVLTIAVAVGASTALFSVVDRLLLRAEPFVDPDRLWAVWESPPRAEGGFAPWKNEVSPGTFGDWSAGRGAFDGVGVVLAFALRRAISAVVLYGVSAHDPVIFAIAPTLLGVVAATSALLPALRASRVDAVVALREA